jgi:hypothetical protein
MMELEQKLVGEKSGGMKDKVTVSMERETLNRIKKYGSMDDTYDSVIKRILDRLEDLERKQQRKQ